MKLSDIKPNPDNPRSITDDARAELGESMGEFGDLSGFVFNHDGTIISGHQRWEEIKSEVKEFAIRETYEIPLPEGTIQRGHFELNDGRKYDYAVRQWSVEKANAAMIRANKENAGTWDVSKLPKLNFSQQEAVKFGVPEIVFQVDNALNSEKLEAQEDDYEIPDEIKTDIVPGDLFEIGRHRLLCGDSTSVDDVGKLLNGEKPFLMVADPPYGVEYDANWRNEADRANGKPYGATAVWKVSNDERADWTETWSLSPSSVAYVWHADRHAKTVQESIERCNFEVRNQVIWAKSNFAISRGHYHWKHEPCWYAVKKGATSKWCGDHSQTTLWEINKPMKSETGHSTQKPVECMARPIRNHEGDVYDPFLGSGTTMVAAHQLNRRCYGMEIDPKYCQVIVDRMLKLDPTIEIKRNGQPYIKNGD